MANVKKINGYDLIDSKSDYSTSEIDTGKKWIDGKTIYRKVIDTGATVPDEDQTDKNVAHGITNLGTIVSLQCYAYTDTTTFTLPFSIIQALHVVTLNVLINDTNIRFLFNDDTGGHQSPLACDNSYAIIEYTKSE